MLRKDHCLAVSAKFVSVCYIFYDKQLELDTYYERATSPSMWTWHLWQLKIDC